uniref:Mucin-like protein n=1 Tax=Chenopodium quinoa TaxID=63459 RepID=A0A803L1L6_CHEQI
MQRLTKSSTTTLLRQLPFSLLHHCRRLSTSSGNKTDEWNDAWETAWLPDDLAGKNTRAPWESDVNFGLNPDATDPETKALENVQKDYRLKKQRIHAGLWMKEIELIEEAKVGGGSADDIDKLLDSCSEIFDSASNNLNDPKVPSTSEFKNKPDGWESTSKSEDGNVWEMSQREEDILLQEFERRMAFCKFQIASFIKTHIFSRRRPIDGWRYMIEVIGPNARKGKGSASRLPGLADPATQPFTEDRTPRTGGRLSRSILVSTNRIMPYSYESSPSSSVVSAGSPEIGLCH